MLGVLAVAVYCQPVDETAMEAVSGALSHTGYEVTVTERRRKKFPKFSRINIITIHRAPYHKASTVSQPDGGFVRNILRETLL